VQTDVRLGFMTALDLTMRAAGDPHISKCFETRIQKFNDDVERLIVVCRVPGNREMPSMLSKPKPKSA
jgi:hypothetical protein